MDEKLRTKLLQSKRDAQRYAEEINRCRREKAEFPMDSLKGYIRSKFILNEEDMQVEKISELAKLSVARQHHIELKDIKYKDGLDCAGATSSMTKKILLIMAIEKDMEVFFTEEQSGEIETVSDIAQLIQTIWNEEE